MGGVSATANPVANSSGSVTNQAIQVLQGPYITDTFGNGVSCQGPTLNITPFLTQTKSWQLPYESIYQDPVYNNADNNDDGIPDNPGEVLYYVPTRTGQKNQHNWNWGLSATVSIPLDGGIQERCKTAATTQNRLNQQILINKRLDFEMARLKHGGEQTKLGVTFHPQSPYAKICADIVVKNPHGVIPQHAHTIPVSSSTPSKEVNPVSLDNDLHVPQKETTSEEDDQASSGWFQWPFSRQASQPLEEDLPEASLGGPMSLPQSQSLP